MAGALLVDKPPGPTSHDIVAVVRRALKTPRVGHTGTLDPLATGLLVVLVGAATRLARFLAADEKEYLADVRLGIATPTYACRGPALTRRGRSRGSDGRSLEDQKVATLEQIVALARLPRHAYLQTAAAFLRRRK